MEEGGDSRERLYTWQCVRTALVHVYLCVKRFVDVYTVVLALLNDIIPTFPDESCWRVGVDSAAQEHRLLLVVTATDITDSLVHCQDRCVKVWKTQKILMLLLL